MEELKSLKNHLLISMPSLADSWFDTTVIFLCEHNEEGAMGIVLNKRSQVDFSQLCDQLKIDNLSQVHPTIMNGGPVNPEHGLILHTKTSPWKSTINIGGHIQLTSSQDVLHAIADSAGPKEYIIALGYAGWSAGQLDEELRDNAWLILKATPELVFEHQDTELYKTALARLGVSAEFLSSESGHA